MTTLQAEYTRLQGKKEKLYADYSKLKKQAKEYNVIKLNVDSILKQQEAEAAKDRDAEL